jgi:hypothetical protein
MLDGSILLATHALRWSCERIPCGWPNVPVSVPRLVCKVQQRLESLSVAMDARLTCLWQGSTGDAEMGFVVPSLQAIVR